MTSRATPSTRNRSSLASGTELDHPVVVEVAVPPVKLAAKALAGRVKDTATAGKRPLLAAVVRPAAKPSRTLLASLDALDARVTSRVDVVQVDIDESPDVMNELRVSYEPELLLFEGGRIVERTEGEMTAEQIAELVEHALAPR